jgi:DNA-directed RNA polymerase specialized sigma24 family protein
MTNEASDRRDAQDELIVAALASGRDYEAAAAVAGISSRTVRRRHFSALAEAATRRAAQPKPIP